MAEAAVNATGNHVRPLGRHTKDHGQGGFDHRSARSHSSAGWTPKPRPPQGWVLPAPGGKVRSGPLSSARGRPPPLGISLCCRCSERVGLLLL